MAALPSPQPPHLAPKAPTGAAGRQQRRWKPRAGRHLRGERWREVAEPWGLLPVAVPGAVAVPQGIGRAGGVEAARPTPKLGCQESRHPPGSPTNETSPSPARGSGLSISIRGLQPAGIKCPLRRGGRAATVPHPAAPPTPSPAPPKALTAPCSPKPSHLAFPSRQASGWLVAGVGYDAHVPTSSIPWASPLQTTPRSPRHPAAGVTLVRQGCLVPRYPSAQGFLSLQPPAAERWLRYRAMSAPRWLPRCRPRSAGCRG